MLESHNIFTNCPRHTAIRLRHPIVRASLRDADRRTQATRGLKPAATVVQSLRDFCGMAENKKVPGTPSGSLELSDAVSRALYGLARR